MDDSKTMLILENLKQKVNNIELFNIIDKLDKNLIIELENKKNTLETKLAQMDNYIENSSKDYVKLIEECLNEDTKELNNNNNKINTYNYRVNEFKRSISDYKKTLDSISNNIDNIKDANSYENMDDVFNEEQRYETYNKELKHLNDTLDSFNEELDELERKNSKLNSKIENYQKILMSFNMDKENSIDDVEIKKDKNELELYKYALEKYKKLREKGLFSLKDDIDLLIYNYENKLISLEDFRTKLEEYNLALQSYSDPDISIDDFEKINNFCKEHIDNINKKLQEKNNYISIGKNDEDEKIVLDYLENEQMAIKNQLELNRKNLVSVTGIANKLDVIIKNKEEKKKILDSKLLKFVSDLDINEKDEINEKIVQYTSEIKDTKNLKKDLLKKRRQLEKENVNLLDEKDKYLDLFNSRNKINNESNDLDIVSIETDKEKLDLLNNCLSILNINSDNLKLDLNYEIEALSSINVNNDENIANKKNPVYSLNSLLEPKLFNNNSLQDELNAEQEMPKEEENEVQEMTFDEINSLQDELNVEQEMPKEEENEVQEMTFDEINSLQNELNVEQEMPKEEENEVQEMTFDEINSLQDELNVEQEEPKEEENEVQINIGNDVLRIKNVDANGIVSDDEVIILEDDNTIHQDLCKKVINNISPLQRFFNELSNLVNDNSKDEKEKLSLISDFQNNNKYKEDISYSNNSNDDYLQVSDNDGNQYNFNLRNDALEELSLADLKNLLNEVRNQEEVEEYKGGSYGK